jgi:hypothetical protein
MVVKSAKECFLEQEQEQEVSYHVDALKPPGGTLFLRNAEKHHLANYKLMPKTVTDGN